MNKYRNFVVFSLFLFLTASFVYAISADDTKGKELIKSGLEKFSNAQYSQALLDFREVVLDPAYKDYYDSAYFWITRCYMAEKNLDKAETNLEFFIQNFPNSRFYPESIYQKGRLLFLQKDYDSSIQVLYSYIKSYPDQPFVSNSYYWIAEALFELGHLDKAQKIYSYIVKNYPSSYKIEASRYKLSLIDLKLHEEELLKLLRLSHEEYLKVVDDFQRREKTYEQAIASYQRKLVAASNNDTKQILIELNADIAEKDDEIAVLNRKLSECNEQLQKMGNQKQIEVSSDKNAAGTKSGAEEEFKELLILKNEALDLKSFYLDWLKSNSGE